MKNKLQKFMVFVLMLGITASGVFALTRFFATKSHTTRYVKKTIFQLLLNVGDEERELGPGESTQITSNVYNDGTEPMLVFLEMIIPSVGSETLYTYQIGDEWKLVQSKNESFVYAYATSEMITLLPGETTTNLTDRLTMRSISNAEYAYVEDINVTINAYTIGTDGVSLDPTEAWLFCKELGVIDL